MQRLARHSRLVVATHNAGKLREMCALLAPYGIETVSAGDLGLPEPAETGSTFVANAQIKALSAARAARLPAFADDSGLCVAALADAPGIYSARWAREAGDFGAAMRRIEDALREAQAMPPFRAHFVSALCLAQPHGETVAFEGRVDGELVFPPRGKAGFGYDPIFQPDGYATTFGEMSAAAKHGLPADGSPALSHRARAFQAFAAACLPQRSSEPHA